MVIEALGDLRKTLEFAEDMGNLEYVDGADQDLEIGALYELSLEDSAPPVLVFRNIKGFPSGHRVVVNVRSSKVFDNGEEGLERERGAVRYPSGRICQVRPNEREQLDDKEKQKKPEFVWTLFQGCPYPGNA